MKTTYRCEICGREFTYQGACIKHEAGCGERPDWFKVGNCVGRSCEGDVWVIEEIDETIRMVKLHQLGFPDHVVHSSISSVVGHYDNLTVERFSEANLPRTEVVYIPGDLEIESVFEGVVTLSYVANPEITVNVPLKHLHQLALFKGTELPAAKIIYHDKDSGEDMDYRELCGAYDFEG